MSGRRCRIVLWTGPKHSGKTTSAAKLIEHLRQAGLAAGGILSPSVYQRNQLIGFDVVDIRSNQRHTLARRGSQDKLRIGAFALDEQGLALGCSALDLAGGKADLVLVDEFGPLELKGLGWRRAVDNLLENTARPVVLVVRDELVEQVAQLYGHLSPQSVPALSPEAIPMVLSLLVHPPS